MAADVEEALRYLGAAKNPPAELRAQAQQAMAELESASPPRYVYRVLEVVRRGKSVFLPGAGLELPGESAGIMLADCARAALLCCTLGAGFDALLRRAQAGDMARAVVLDACGSALVESGCDRAQEEISGRFPGLFQTDRFSPGYGDLPLSIQPELCAALDAQRRLGVCVGESLLMTPIKTVTALAGLSERPQAARIRGCAHCAMSGSCQLKRGGKTCAV